MHKSVTVTAACLCITSVAPLLCKAVVRDQIMVTVCIELVMLLPFEMVASKIGTGSATSQLDVVFKSTLLHFALVCCLFIAHSAIWWPACCCKKCNFSPRHKDVSVLFWAVSGFKSLPAVDADDGLLLLQHGQKHPLCHIHAAKVNCLLCRSELNLPKLWQEKLKQWE